MSEAKSEASELSDLLSEEDILQQLAYRIRNAGAAGKGCRLTAKETRLLQYCNLPCTADDPSVNGR